MLVSNISGTSFPLRREVAVGLFPGIAPQNAVKRMNHWIHTDPELNCLLQLHGYTPHSRRLTPRQVRVIREYIC